MNRMILHSMLVVLAAVAVQGRARAEEKSGMEDGGAGSIFDFTMADISGAEVPFERYRGRALLIVNTASKCGYTPQYAGLQELYRRFHDSGFEVIGIPANDFGQQEPGTNEEILDFVRTHFEVSFPMFGKTVVKGPGKCPLYRFLTEESGEPYEGEIRWNFTKFLIDPDGRVVARFESDAEPLSPEIVQAVEAVLPAK